MPGGQARSGTPRVCGPGFSSRAGTADTENAGPGGAPSGGEGDTAGSQRPTVYGPQGLSHHGGPASSPGLSCVCSFQGGDSGAVA